MKIITTVFTISFLLLFGFATQAQQTGTSSNPKQVHESGMKTYLIERDIPNAGKLTPTQLQGVSQTSCNVLKDMDGIEWVHSYVTGNKIYCVYKAESEALIRDHGKKGGFPVTNIMEIATVISPATAKAN